MSALGPVFLRLFSLFWPNRAAGRIPLEVLRMILEASEESPPRDELLAEWEDSDEALATFGLIVPGQESFTPFGLLWKTSSARTTAALRKFQENQKLRILSQVCRAWRYKLIQDKALWKDIALDVTEPKSIRLAKEFFDMIKDSNVTFRIYAGLGSSAHPDVQVLFQELRVFIDRWECFEYQGNLTEYRPYLDLEARKLLRFSGFHDFSSTTHPTQSLFAGKAPSLRQLCTSEISKWSSDALSNVTELNIAYGPRNSSFSVSSLIDVFRSTPNLKALQLASPRRLVLDAPASETVALLKLETLRLFNTDVYSLITHLEIPRIQGMTFSSNFDRRNHFNSHPIFDSPDLFSPFPQTPLFAQEFSLVRIQIGFACNGALRFSVYLSDDDKHFFGINLNLLWEGSCQWKDYFADSITRMTERVQLRAGAVLELTLEEPTDCETLLGFGDVGTLKFDGAGREVLHKLICTSHGNPPAMLFPRLEELVLLSAQMDDYDFALIPPCLRSRDALTIVVSDTNSSRLGVINNQCEAKADPNLPGYLRIRLRDSRIVIH